jgi:hypothetical protein
MIELLEVVSDIKGSTWTYGIGEQDSEENIWAYGE